MNQAAQSLKPAGRTSIPFLAVSLVVLSFGSGLWSPALADTHKTELEKARELIAAGTRDLIDSELGLSGAEAESFWTVYERFDDEMDLLGAQYVRLIETYMDRYLRGALDEEEADRLTDEYFTLQIGMLRVRQKYLGEFRDVIGGLKTARLYQLQNKIKAEADYALAEAIPLTEIVP